MNYPHPLLAREGWPFIGLALFASLAMTFFWGWAAAAPAYVVLVFVIQFFRDPPRVVPELENAVLSPADGRIVKIENVFDPYAQRDAILVSVFMNVFNVHSNRASVNGQVRAVQYFPGLFVNADLDKASTENERSAVIIDAQINGQQKVVTLVQVAGLIARRILCYVHPGDTLEKGQRYGFIRFGSRVDVYLPLTAQVQVAPGDKVSATSTILATL